MISGEAEVKKSETLDFIPGMSKIRVEDIPSEIFGDLETTFNKALHQMARELPRAKSVFVNSFEALDPTITADLDSKFQRFLNVGPLSLILNQPGGSLDSYECLPWLDTQETKSVAYISFGTVAAPPPHELFAIAEALEERHTPFLWSLKDHSRVHLPEGFLDRTSELGKIVPWAPQVNILAHSSVGVFITHCGWNSVLEGVISGVPMIGRPFFGDQKVNARVITNVLEIGSVIDGGEFTKNGLRESLEVILTGEVGRSMRERAEELKRAAQEAVKEDGSSAKNLRILLEQVNQV